ncbi:DHA2 family efflux MFS transporter permease subunit [Streptomyces sp. NPDC051684]|uniref:DHA2 family efflux MFS transporter permease subunit n=1 Tax=Streptomyces sp. NPDC051684 TaxID=3365670 RepID=UPI0037B760FF
MPTPLDARERPAAASSAQPPGAPAAHHVPHRWWVLAVIGLAQLMVVLDATIVNIALPSAQADLGFSDDGRQWVVTAYSLAFGSLLLLGGKLSDLFGRKNTLIIGLIGFAGSSALAGAATGFSMLVAGRALQGVFGAILAPTAMALLTTTFTEPKDRARAFGIFGAIAGSGGAIGMLLGGFLTEHLDWRWTLYVNLVIAAFAVVGALVFIRKPAPGPRPKLDLMGTLLVAAGLFSIVFGFSNAETHSWGNWMCWVFLAAGVVLLALFIFWQTRAKHPLLPLRVLADRNRAASYVSVFITGAGMFGIFLFLTYYLQTILGKSPMETGVAFLPMILSLMITAQIATMALIPKLGPKPVVPVGMGLTAGGLVWLTALDVTSSYASHVLPPLIMIGVGIGLVMPPAMSLATLGVDPKDQGVAAATVNTMQQVGGSIGTALFSTMAATAATNYIADHGVSKSSQAEAAVHSYATAYWWAAGFFVAGLVISVLMYRAGRPHAQAQQKVESTSEAAEAAETAGEAVAAAAAVTPVATAPAVEGPGVHGRILDGQGAPLSGAVVTLIDRGGAQIGRGAAASDGSYAVSAPSGDGEGYVLVGSAPGRDPRVATLALRADGPVSFDLVLSGDGGLYGTVRSESDSAPVVGALVVTTDERGETVGSALTDPDGGYSLPQLPPGAYTFTASAEGFQPYAGQAQVAGGTATRQDALLRSAATLTGTVRGTDGSPVNDARVTLLDQAGNVVAVHTTGDDGAYAFAGLSGATYTVIASGYPPVSKPVTVAGSGNPGDLDVALGHGD